MADEYAGLGTQVGATGVAAPAAAARPQPRQDWDGIADSAAYKVLSTARKQARKEQYFHEVLAPKIGSDPQKLAAAHQQFKDYEPGRKLGFGESALRSFGLEANKVAAAEPFVAAAAPVLIGKGLGLAHESIEWLRQHHLPGAGHLASASQALKEGQDWASDQADQLFRQSDALRQQGQDYYGPKAGERFNHAGQLVGSLPVQMATLPLQSAERGQELINQGVPAGAAQRAVIGNTAFNVATAPLRGVGANVLTRVGTGALVGGGTGVAQRLLEKAELGDDAPEDVRQAPLLSGDDAVGAVVGGALGAHGGGKAVEPAPRLEQPDRAGRTSTPAVAPDAAAPRTSAPQAAADPPAPPSVPVAAPSRAPATRPGAERTGESAVADDARDAGQYGSLHPVPPLAAAEHAHGEAAAGVAPGTLDPGALAAATHLVQTDPASAMRLHARHPENEAAFNAAVQERNHANREAAEQAGGADARGAGDRGAAPPAASAGQRGEPGAPAQPVGRAATEPAPASEPLKPAPREPAPQPAGRAGVEERPPGPPPEPPSQEAPRAPDSGARSFQEEVAQPGRLLDSINTITVPKGDGSRHQVLHADSGRVIAEGRNAAEADARAQELARQLGRRRMQAKFGMGEPAAEPAGRTSSPPSFGGNGGVQSRDPLSDSGESLPPSGGNSPRNSEAVSRVPGSEGSDTSVHSAYNYQQYKKDLIRQELANPGDPMRGPVLLKDPMSGATPAQQDQIRRYGQIADLALHEGHISASGRVSTKGGLRSRASSAARAERARARVDGKPYRSVAAHGPDTTWTGLAEPPFWLDMDAMINSSLGSQARNYPRGYRPTRFIYEGDL